METITYNNLPEAITNVLHRLEKIEDLIKEKNKQNTFRKRYNLIEALEYIEQETGKKFSKQTIYSNISALKISAQKVGRNLIFEKSELDAWMLRERKYSGKILKERAIRANEQFLQAERERRGL